MRVFSSLTEVARSIGTHVGDSAWHAIEQSHIDRFADVTGDFQWIHVDPQRAAQGPWGGTIAHGYLTLSLLPSLMWETYRFDNVSAQMNYGCNKVRFPSPVAVGSLIRASFDFLSLTESGPGQLLSVRATVHRDGAERPVCVAETLTYLVI